MFVIATPMYESAKPWYCDSLARTCAAYPEAQYLYLDHMYIDDARERLAEIAKEFYPTGILWIDSDMSWDVEDVRHVIERDHIVCGIYPARKEDVILREGFGFVWTPISCFDQPQPWFFSALEMSGAKKGFTRIGEDLYFMRRMRSAGVEVESYESDTIYHAYEPGPRRTKDLK